jgi:meiotically up-regulated gene 157 (Mug157) protein
MIYSAFRPSDDACKFGYLLPANLFFLNEIKNLPLAHSRTRFDVLAKEIDSGINTFGIANGIYAYEVDGFGNNLLIDDANVPSLLSLPFLEVCKIDDPKYQATRKFILSEQNPYYFSGSKAFGIGSQHTPENYVWPISIAMSAMTSGDSKVQLAALEMLENNDAGTGYMHESFDVNDDSSFTREWFSWSDMTYVDLVLTASDFKN